MIVYKVFCKNYGLKKGDLIGILVERRKDLRGLTQIESGLRWAKLAFTHSIKDKNAMFVVPKELQIGFHTQSLVEKGVFTREELLGISELLS
ncbi:MAG: hypothetical protein FJ110_06275 [Deltaproteobacteria bacterium]|nr:hypothetical protein [Deltaproteobacteria bacterium]